MNVEGILKRPRITRNEELDNGKRQKRNVKMEELALSFLRFFEGKSPFDNDD